MTPSTNPRGGVLPRAPIEPPKEEPIHIDLLPIKERRLVEQCTKEINELLETEKVISNKCLEALYALVLANPKKKDGAWIMAREILKLGGVPLE
jgi:hypothetical protein